MRLRTRTLALSFAAATIAGCNADKALVVDTGPLSVTAVQQNVVSISSSLVADQVLAIGAGNAGAGVSFLVAPSAGQSLVMSAVAPGCTGPNGSGYYVCASRVEHGMQVVRMFRFFALGAIATGPAANTDSLQHIWSTTGQDTVSEGTKVRIRIVNRADTGTSIITRDTTPAHNPSQFTNNGHGTVNDTVTWTDSGKTVRMVTTGHAIVANVVRKAPESANPYPFSGTITFSLGVQATAQSEGHSESRSVNETAVVTFNNTRYAQLVTGGKTCTFDLVTRKASDCH